MGRAKSSLGVDLGSQSIKVVQIRRTGRDYCIDHAAIIPVRRSADDPYSVEQPDLLLRGHLATAGLRPGATVCSVDRGQSTVRSLRLPVSKPTDLDQMARYEAETLVPFPIDSVQLGYASSGAHGDMADVVIAACPVESLQGRMGFFASSGVAPTELAVSSLALYNCLMAAMPERRMTTQLVVDMGARCTEVLVVSEGALGTSLSLKHGGDGLTESLAEDLKMDTHEAENHKRTKEIAFGPETGLPPADMPATRAWLTRLYEQLRRVSDAHHQDGTKPRIEAVVLCGQSAEMPGFATALGAGLQLPVVILDPLASLPIDDRVVTARHGPAFANAVGFALQGLGEAALQVNLRPADVSARGPVSTSRVWALAWAAFLVLIVGTYAMVSSGLSRDNEKLEDLQGRISRLDLTGRGDEAASLADLEQYRQIAARVQDPSADWFGLFGEMCDVLPPDLSLRSWTCERGKEVTLRGRALSNAAVADAVDALRGLDRFTSVRPTHSSAVKASGRTVYDFEIRAELPKPEKPKTSAPKDTNRST